MTSVTCVFTHLMERNWEATFHLSHASALMSHFWIKHSPTPHCLHFLLDNAEAFKIGKRVNAISWLSLIYIQLLGDFSWSKFPVQVSTSIKVAHV